MKKLVIISLLTAMLVVTATGCSGSEPTEQTQSVVKVSSVQPITEESRESDKITALYASPESCKLKIGENRTINISSDKGAVLSSDLMWVCDDESIAVVDSSGNVIGKTPGNCIITVRHREHPDLSKNIPITVKPNDESSTASSKAPAAQTSQVSQTSSVSTSNQPAAVTNGGGTTIIYVTPPSGSVTYSVPRQYTYYYGKNNFSYSNPADGYVIHSMVGNYLSQADVSRITRHDAQMLINAIYAKHGYIFKDAEVRSFFETQDWYNSISGKTGDMQTISDRISSIAMDNYNLNILLAIR